MLSKKIIVLLLIPLLSVQVEAATNCTTGQRMADSGNAAAQKSMSTMDNFVSKTEDAFRDANTQCFTMLKQIPSILPGTSALPLPALVGPIVTKIMGQVINDQFTKVCDSARVRGGDLMGKINTAGSTVGIPNTNQLINSGVQVPQVPQELSTAAQITERVRSIFK